MPVANLNLNASTPGTYVFEDDGNPTNSTFQVRLPDGSVVIFEYPTTSLLLTASNPGIVFVFNLTESLGAASFTVGSLTTSTLNPDSIQVDTLTGNGAFTLVSNGPISEFFSDAAADVVAGSLVLSAVTGIGIGGNALETQVSSLEAETVSGGIAITNYGGVQIGGLTPDVAGLQVTNSGDIVFTAFGSIQLADTNGTASVQSGTISGNITLVANGPDSDITSIVNTPAIRGNRGDLTLVAGRDVLFGIGAGFNNDVVTNRNLTITAGRDLVIDSEADLTANSFGNGTGGDILITVGRNISINNAFGNNASIATGSIGSNVTLVTGPGGTLTVSAPSPNIAIVAFNADVTISADRMLIGSNSLIQAPTGSVTLVGATGGRPILLGSATDGTIALELSDAELDRITASNLILGTSASGPVSVLGTISPGGAGNVTINSGTNINVLAGVSTATSLALRPLDDLFLAAGSTVTTGTFNAFVDTVDDDLSVGGRATLNGTVAAAVAAVINGNLDGDVINGSGAAELIFGLGGNDILNGNGGNDSLDGGAGIDTTNGGLGDDSHFVDRIDDVVVETAGQGTDTVFTPVTYILREGFDVENLVTTNPAGTGAINLTGNSLANNIQGNAGANVLLGLGGNDTILGFAGADTVDGGTGADSLNGGTGDDIYFVDTIDDLAIEAAGEGSDIVFTTVTYVLREAFAVEALIASPAASGAALNLTGNGLANNIQGNAGDNVLLGNGGADILLGFAGTDTLDGGTGADTMAGGAGDDIYFVDSIDDQVVENPGEGTNDRIFTSVTYILRDIGDVEQLVTANQAATTALNLTGNSFANILQGNNGNNILDGKGGNDTLLGFGGVDTFVFSTPLNGVSNVDSIVGFLVAEDRILLDGTASGPFASLPAGTLSASAFTIGSGATTAAHRVIYNSASGGLFFDPDGNGAAPQVQFALLPTGLALANNNFIVADPLAFAASPPPGAPPAAAAAPAAPAEAAEPAGPMHALFLAGGDGADLPLARNILPVVSEQIVQPVDAFALA